MFLCPQGYNSLGDPNRQHKVEMQTDLNACFLIDQSSDLSFIDDLQLQIINFNNSTNASLENSSAQSSIFSDKKWHVKNVIVHI